MSLFSYISLIVGIRDDEVSHIVTPNTIYESNPQNVHKKLLAKLADDGVNSILVFENELLLTRPMGDINNNEIETFMAANNTWDLILLSPFNLAKSTKEPGYTLMSKVLDTTTFYSSYIYLASHRFMTKLKNNDLSSIQTYKYDSPFLNHIQNKFNHNKFTIGKISNIVSLTVRDLKYKWNDFKIN